MDRFLTGFLSRDFYIFSMKKKSKNLEKEGKIALWVSVIIVVIITIWAFFFIIMS